MIIRGEWRLRWKALGKRRDELSPEQRIRYRLYLILLIPVCAIYWVLFKLAEAFEWVSDRLVDAGYFVHERIWEKKEAEPNE